MTPRRLDTTEARATGQGANHVDFNDLLAIKAGYRTLRGDAGVGCVGTKLSPEGPRIITPNRAPTSDPFLATYALREPSHTLAIGHAFGVPGFGRRRWASLRARACRRRGGAAGL